jgi:hypothetical protein
MIVLENLYICITMKEIIRPVKISIFLAHIRKITFLAISSGSH